MHITFSHFVLNLFIFNLPLLEFFLYEYDEIIKFDQQVEFF
jgi:hypothetical protein